MDDPISWLLIGICIIVSFFSSTCETAIGLVNRFKLQVKADDGKPKLTLVPRQIIFDIAKIREYGNNKYPEGGPDNWKTVSKERYRDALFRHFMAYLDDPTGVDSESGLPHLWHLACNVAFLCEMEEFDCDHNS